MSEAEIVAELATRTDMIWGYVQWWASISLALIAASYLASDRKLTIPILIAMLTVYSLYSYMIALAVGAQTGFLRSAINALATLEQIGPLGQYALEEIDGESGAFRGLIIRITLVSVYSVTVIYPIYSAYSLYRENRINDNAN